MDAFIRSPYFSRGRNLSPLYSYIKSLYPHFETGMLKSEIVFNSLYPSKHFNSKSSGILIRKLFSELHSVAEEFILIRTLKENNGIQYLLKLSEYSKRDLPNHFEKIAKSAEEFASKHLFTIAEKNKYQYEIIEHKINYYSEKGQRGVYGEFIEESIKRLIKFFYFSLVINLQALNTENFSFRKINNSPFTENFMNSFNSDSFAKNSNNPSIEIYNLFLLEVQNKHDLNTVLKLFELLEKHKHLFIKKELHDLYLGLSSMCTEYTIRDSTNIYLKQLLFNIYKSSSSNGVMVDPSTGKIDLLKFRNVLNSALNCSDPDYAQDFINKYVSCLPKSAINNTKALSFAMLEHFRGNPQKALDLLSDVRQSKFVFINDLKFLQMKCYYDLNYFDNADSLINSYRQFIKYSTSTSNVHKKYILEFLKQYKMLWEIKITGNKKLFDKLKTKLSGSESSWIYQKLVMLKNK